MAISNNGRPTEETCPKCGARILYNGNYFCKFWDDGCDWALPHPQTELVDQQISYRLGGYYEDGNDGTSLGRMIYEYPE